MPCLPEPLYLEWLVQISMLSANAVQLLWRIILAESLLHALPFCTMCGYCPYDAQARHTVMLSEAVLQHTGHF